MEPKEYNWLKEKAGWISTSKLDSLTSKSGKWVDTNISYLREIERQRLLGQPSPPIHSRPLEIGVANEVYAVEWLRANTNMTIRHCDKDYDTKIFKKTPYGFGSSPDTFIVENEALMAEKIVGIIEIKCVVGLSNLCFYFSPTESFEDKRIFAFEEHRNQLAGQLIAYPEIEKIHLLKYDPQLDDDEFDTRSVLDPSRGILFNYSREEFGTYLDTIKDRTIFADGFLKSKAPMKTINQEWEIYLKSKNI